jgi:hypothetical protein
MAYNWKIEMGTVLRVLLNDLSAPYQYSDERLYQLLAVAAQQVQAANMSFPLVYKVNISQLTMNPDPTNSDAGTRDDSFINLVTLRAACITSHGEARISAKQGISIRDGSSAIDLTGPLQGRLKLIEIGYCESYDQSKLEYQTARIGTIAGATILTPFRVFAGFGEQAYYPMQEGRQTFVH